MFIFYLGYGTLREDKTVVNVGSDPSDVCSHSSPELPSPVHRTLGPGHSSEDLYSWMAKQDAVTSNLEGKYNVENVTLCSLSCVKMFLCNIKIFITVILTIF